MTLKTFSRPLAASADRCSIKSTGTSSIKHVENFAMHKRLARANIQVDEICKSSGVPGASIGVIHNGDVIHTYNFGYRDVGNQLPTTSDTVYGIGSVTKSFFEASGGIYSNLDDMLKWSKAMLDAAQATPRLGCSVLKQVPQILSSHIAIKNPSLRERSYGYGWIRTQLPGVVGLVGDNAGLWDMEDSPILSTPDQPLLMIYHQGSTVGYYTFIALFPDSNSAVVVLINSIAISDAADWIGRVFIQALFHLQDNNDYVKLAEEGNQRVIKSIKILSTKGTN